MRTSSHREKDGITEDTVTILFAGPPEPLCPLLSSRRPVNFSPLHYMTHYNIIQQFYLTHKQPHGGQYRSRTLMATLRPMQGINLFTSSVYRYAPTQTGTETDGERGEGYRRLRLEARGSRGRVIKGIDIFREADICLSGSLCQCGQRRA